MICTEYTNSCLVNVSSIIYSTNSMFYLSSNLTALLTAPFCGRWNLALACQRHMQHPNSIGTIIVTICTIRSIILTDLNMGCRETFSWIAPPPMRCTLFCASWLYRWIRSATGTNVSFTHVIKSCIFKSNPVIGANKGIGKFCSVLLGEAMISEGGLPLLVDKNTIVALI